MYVTGLCIQEGQESLRDAIELQPSVEQHEYVLGEDATGHVYIHFPQFCGADLRVYRHAPPELPTFDLPEPSPAKVRHKQKITKCQVMIKYEAFVCSCMPQSDWSKVKS